MKPPLDRAWRFGAGRHEDRDHGWRGLRRRPTSAPSACATPRPRSDSRPASSSACTASALPVRAATISGVSPSADGLLASAPASISIAMTPRAAVDRRQPQRRRAVAVGRLHVGAGANQRLHQRRRVLFDGPVQRRGAVGLRRVHVGLRGHQPPARRAGSPAFTASTSALRVRARRRRGPWPAPISPRPAASLRSARLSQTFNGSRFGTRPELSTNESRCTPTLSSSVRCRLASGVGLLKRMCRPPLNCAPRPPATTIGRFE